MERARFQVIEHTQRLFKDSIGVDILAGLTQEQVRLLKRVFQKRHVHDHNEGIVSPRYADEIPEDAPLLGCPAPLTLEGLEAAAGVLQLVLERLVLARWRLCGNSRVNAGRAWTCGRPRPTAGVVGSGASAPVAGSSTMR